MSCEAFFFSLVQGRVFWVLMAIDVDDSSDPDVGHFWASLPGPHCPLGIMLNYTAKLSIFLPNLFFRPNFFLVGSVFPLFVFFRIVL
jgi:hypothetical protein